MFKKKAVPDTSAIIGGIMTREAEKGEIGEIVIPEFVISELQAQASKGRETGFIGLEELKRLRDMERQGKVRIRTAGRKQTMEEIRLAKSGRIDALIVDVAKEERAVFYTCDLVQKMVAEAEGLEVRYFEPHTKAGLGIIDEYLTDDTLSIHLKEGAVPLAKRGKPGEIRLVKLRDEPLSKDEMERIMSDIHETARHENGFLEYSEKGATVYQIGDKRISIARPPFSDGLEVTIVRPIAKVSLDDYRLAEKLRKRLEEKAEGIIIAGPPGSGKSTFAAALAEFYESMGKIVKTMESPRDLQVKPEITQYKPLGGSFEKTADILLLVRPDYTIYDEIRKTEDFRIFSDLRMAGIGMVGVVHATEAVNAIQRFIGRIDIGVIPHIVDTVIFIKDGKIERVLTLDLVVRPPTGMNEDDLARPVVEIRDFETGKLAYEIYTYGDETVVIPIEEEKESPVNRLAEERIYQEIKRFDRAAEIRIISPRKALVRVDNSVMPKIIGRSGKTIQALEEKLGISIDIEPKIRTTGTEVGFSWDEKGNYIMLDFGKSMVGEHVDIYCGDELLLSATIGKRGVLRVSKKGSVGESLLRGLIKGDVRAFA